MSTMRHTQRRATNVWVACLVVGSVLVWWLFSLRDDQIRTMDARAGEWATSQGASRLLRLSTTGYYTLHTTGYYVIWSAQTRPGDPPPAPTYIQCDLSRCEGVPEPKLQSYIIY